MNATQKNIKRQTVRKPLLATLRATRRLFLGIMPLAAAIHTSQAGSADWTAASSVTWATAANWTPAAAPGGAAANTDVAGFKTIWTVNRQPTYPNSAHYLGGWWVSGAPRDITVTSGGSASYALIEAVDGTNVNQTAGTLYGVVMDDSGVARKLTISTRTVEIRDNDQTFYIGGGNTLNCNPSASPQYTALNGRTLTLAGAGATQIRYLNNSASQTGGSIIVSGGRLDLIGSSAGGVSGGIDVQAGGMLVFWANNCMGAAGKSSPLTLESGCVLESGFGGTLVTATPVTVAGDFTFGGYTSLGLGNYPVTLTTASPRITVNASTAGSTLTFGGTVTNTTVAGGNALDMIKDGPAALYLLAPITLRATQTAIVSAGTNNLNGPIGDGSLGYGITLAGSGTLNLSGNNTFLGPVTVNSDGGTLALNGTNSYTGAATVNSGRLATTTACTGAGNYSVAGLATLAVKVASAGATLNMASLAADSGSTLELNFGTFGNPTNAVITIAGVFAPTNAVTLNLVGVQGASGLVPLIKYGTFGGDQMSAFGFTAPPGINAILTNDVVNKTISLSITAPTLVWDGTVDGTWDISGTANWKTNAYYTETGGGGPPVAFDDTASGTNTTITIGTTLSPYAITVNSSSKTYTFTGYGLLAGGATLTKRGSSTLTIATANTLSGAVTVSGGTLELGDGTANNGLLTGDIANNTALVFANPADQIYAGAISGGGTLTKKGAGNLTLGGGNSYGGGTLLKEGTLTLANSTALSSGAVTNTSSSNTVMLALSDNYTLANNFDIVSGTLYLGNSTTAGAAFTGNFTGAGTAYFGRTGTSGGKSVTLSGDWSGFAGTLVYLNGPGASSTYLTLQAAASDFSRATVYTEGRNASCTFLNWNGANNTTVRMGALASGNGGGMIGIAGGITGVTFEVGALNTDSIYGGTIGGGASYREFAITKVGTGKLVLSGTCYQTGATTVSDGVLLVDGTFANASAVTVVNGTLGGYGTINGPVTIQLGATLAPQNLEAGPLKVNNWLALSPSSFTQIRLNKDLGTNDAVTGISAVAYGGTLVVTNLSGTLAVGDSFKLFSATTNSGNFTAFVLPPLGLDLRWAFDTASGVLRVAPSLPTTPTNISYSVSSGALTLSWPADYTGWLAQSNAVSITDSNAWHDVPGSGNTNLLAIPVDPAAPQVFYRLRRP